MSRREVFVQLKKNRFSMAIRVAVSVRDNVLTNERIASARIVDLHTVDFDSFCEYLAQDSIVGPAAVAAVMKQFQKKVPYLLALGNKIEFDSTGSVITPTISGSLSQSALSAKLAAAKKEDREITASDLSVNMLTASFEFKVSGKFKSGFMPEIVRKKSEGEENTDETPDEEGNGGSGSGEPTPAPGGDGGSGSVD